MEAMFLKLVLCLFCIYFVVIQGCTNHPHGVRKQNAPCNRRLLALIDDILKSFDRVYNSGNYAGLAPRFWTRNFIFSTNNRTEVGRPDNIEGITGFASIYPLMVTQAWLAVKLSEVRAYSYHDSIHFNRDMTRVIAIRQMVVWKKQSDGVFRKEIASQVQIQQSDAKVQLNF